MEHLIDYARTELKEVDIYLTSRPQRVAANELYQSLGFRRKETNVYKLEIRE
jgi:ribosomal protein S18 acetylase RimI-like enzyme